VLIELRGIALTVQDTVGRVHLTVAWNQNGCEKIGAWGTCAELHIYSTEDGCEICARIQNFILDIITHLQSQQ
jgi:hypothetical protein